MSKSKYVLYFHCTLYKESSAGVITVHKIIDYFNKNNQPAYIILQNETIGAEGYKLPNYDNGLITPLLKEHELDLHIKEDLIPIVFYPDTINNNPLKASNICRMIFYYDGIYSGKTSLNKSYKEGIIFFSKLIQEKANISNALYQNIVSFPVAKTEIVDYIDNNNFKKSDIFFYDGKFTKNFKGVIPKEIASYSKIDRGEKNSLSQTAIFEKLKKAKLLHVFEDSAIIYEALLLGCPVNIHPDGYFHKNKPLAYNEVKLYGSMSKRYPSEDDIEIAMNEIIDFKEEYKMWCKFGETNLRDLNKNFKYHSQKFSQENITKIRNNIRQSFMYIDRYSNNDHNQRFLVFIKNIAIKYIVSILYKTYIIFIKTNFGKNYIKKYCLLLYYYLPTSLKKIITNYIAKIKS